MCYTQVVFAVDNIEQDNPRLHPATDGAIAATLTKNMGKGVRKGVSKDAQDENNRSATMSTLYDRYKEQSSSELPGLITDIRKSLDSLIDKLQEQLAFTQGEKESHTAYQERLNQYFTQLHNKQDQLYRNLPDDLQHGLGHTMARQDIIYRAVQDQIVDVGETEVGFKDLKKLEQRYEALEKQIDPQHLSPDILSKHIVSAKDLLRDINRDIALANQRPAAGFKKYENQATVALAVLANAVHAPKPKSGPALH